MFLEYYGMREQPFGVTPDPRYLYLSESHREALASLHYGIETRRGFSALVAEPGMGKTSLLVKLLDSLKSSARTAFLFQTDCDPQGFLRGLLKDLGIPGRGKDLARMHEALNKVLLEEMQAGRRFVVVVDEAQNLDDAVLESIRLLSNFETPTLKLMHIVLAGQPQLADRLARPELAQLKQRLGSIARIVRFSPRETSAYIDHRLEVAGHKTGDLFTREARAMIARATLGIPRNINTLCFEALSLGCATQSAAIDANILQEVLADRELGPQRETPPSTLPEMPAVSETHRARRAVHPAEFHSLPYEPVSQFSFAKLAAGFLVFVAVPLFLVFILSAAKVGFANATDEIAARVAGVSGQSGDTALPPPTLPAALQAPKPVALAYTREEAKPVDPPEETQPDDPPDEGSQWSRVVTAQAGENLLDLARRCCGKSDWTTVENIRSLNPSIREPYLALREGQQITLPEGLRGLNADVDAEDARTEREPTRTGSIVVLPRQETAFDIAQAYFGRQDWQTVEEIRALNPQIREPYTGIPAGTRIVLPGQRQPRKSRSVYASRGNTRRQ